MKIRDGNVANRPIYLALGVTADGERDVLGLWAGEHGATLLVRAADAILGTQMSC